MNENYTPSSQQPENPQPPQYSGNSYQFPSEPQNINRYGSEPPKPPQGGAGKAITSMVLGIVGVVFSCIPFLPLPISIVGLILGAISIKNKENGRGMAITGVVLNTVSLALALIYIILIAMGIAASSQFWQEFEKGFYEGFYEGYNGSVNLYNPTV